jgi:hypothetical protein
VIAAFICGAGVGAGLWLIARGWAPPRLALSKALAQLRATEAPQTVPLTIDDGRWAARVGRPIAGLLARSAIRAPASRGVRRDFAVLGRTAETHSAEKVTLALVGLLMVPATAA